MDIYRLQTFHPKHLSREEFLAQEVDWEKKPVVFKSEDLGKVLDYVIEYGTKGLHRVITHNWEPMEMHGNI